MSIQFPGWYKGGFPDAEAVMVNLLTPHLAACTPAPTCVTFLPTDYTDVGLPVVWINRMPAVHHDPDEPLDRPLITIRCLATSRADSWEISEYVRQIMRSYRRGGPVRMDDGSLVNVVGIDETLGPTEIAELDYDFRLIPTSYRLALRLPRGIPDYARERPAT